MANMAAKVTAAFFDSKGIRYDLVGDDSEAILTGFGLDNLEGVRFLIVFDKSEEAVAIRTRDFAKFPEAKKADMFKLVNELNRKFRWVKFIVDEEECTIAAEDDAVIQLDSCGEEVFRCCCQLADIVDESYPIIMKAIYA
ncbi:YbjN domain-containing protein [Butyrivibrio sp. AE2032]|uniref:YbjN domain-containing protein n=1 Tax=Butyrivibrio sp. AE2032 TaxID=1458463 RepID=UPI00054ED5BD|nr:YbjN domain-containing protein [Butyrivibrio sp. AE2032]